MISLRYAAPILALLSGALLPTFIHQYLGLTIDDGRKVDAIGWQLAGLTGEATSRRPSFGAAYESHDWLERRYTGTAGEVTLFVARSFDAKHLYHHPENVVLRGKLFESRGTRRFEPRPDIPVHVLTSVGSGGELAAYALLYDDRFVDNPYLFQLRTSWELLIGGRKPMTLFFVHDASKRPDTPLEGALAIRVLHEAIAHFIGQRTNEP